MGRPSGSARARRGVVLVVLVVLVRRVREEKGDVDTREIADTHGHSPHQDRSQVGVRLPVQDCVRDVPDDMYAGMPATGRIFVSGVAKLPRSVITKDGDRGEAPVREMSRASELLRRAPRLVEEAHGDPCHVEPARPAISQGMPPIIERREHRADGDQCVIPARRKDCHGGTPDRRKGPPENALRVLRRKDELVHYLR